MQLASNLLFKPFRPLISNFNLRRMSRLVGAIDQGTSSTRFMVFDEQGIMHSSHQVEFPQIYPKEGWAEHNPLDILASVETCMEAAVQKLEQGNKFKRADIKAVGITNQRETTVVWDKHTGKPLHNAIVWLDTRTQDTCQKLIGKLGDKDALRSRCGLPITTYFSAVKLRWLMDHVPEVAKAIAEKRAMVGTVDSWLLYRLIGEHVTDVSNASRTMLLNLETLQWDESLCALFGLPPEVLPAVRSSAEVYGHLRSGPLAGLPVSGCLGDQQAALVGQRCLSRGLAKNTYGTGCFLLYNTGEQPIASKAGLLTTVAYKLGNEPPHYALEGSIAIAGAAVAWLQRLGLASSAQHLSQLAASVPDTAGVYFVPAFSGLFAPYWKSEARGVLVGLTQFTTAAHIARACLEAVCFQTVDVVRAMEQDSGTRVEAMKVDGGMTNSQLLLQLQADYLNTSIARPQNPETTALGAALAAGYGAGVWPHPRQFSTAAPAALYQPALAPELREARYQLWKKAVERADWPVAAL